MNEFTKKNKDALIKAYSEENKSTYEIAQELGTYPNKVRRALISLGIDIKDKSKAQSLAIESGRHPHPTKGTTHDESTKVKISEKLADNWRNMSDQEYQTRVSRAQKQWEEMSHEEKVRIHELASKALRKTTTEGSKMEKFLTNYLKNAGYNVIFHKKGLIPNKNLEIDLFIPTLKTAIEIDGPAHFFPVWGEERLQKHIRADAEKAGLLLNAGMVVIRVKHLAKNISDKHMRDLSSAVLDALKKIEKKFPGKNNRYIELEVK